MADFPRRFSNELITELVGTPSVGNFVGTFVGTASGYFA